MFCGECGNSLSSTEKFCSKCGTRTAESDSPKVEEPKEVNTSDSVKNPTVEFSKRSKVITVLGVLGVLTIGILYLQYINSSQYRIDTFDREYDAKIELERQTQSEPIQQEPYVNEEPKSQPTVTIQKDLGQEYAKNLASQLERSGHPGCQMLAVAIRSIGYGNNPTEIKMRQIDAVVDKAPGVCFN